MIARRILVIKLVEFQTQNMNQSLEALKNISRLALSIKKIKDEVIIPLRSNYIEVKLHF